MVRKIIKSKGIRIVTRYSEVLKLKVAQEVEGGSLTVTEAMRAYGVLHRKTINRWVHRYGSRRYPTKIVRVEMKSEREKIEDLESALAAATIKARVLEAQLESYQKYVPDLKKKLDAKQLEKFEKNEEKIKQFR